MSLKYGFWSYVCLIVLSIPGALFRAYALATLWQWFAAPLGLPTIGKAAAYGLGLLVGLAALHSPAVKDKDIAEASDAQSRAATGTEKFVWISIHAAQAFLPTAMVLGFGYIAHLCMGL